MAKAAEPAVATEEIVFELERFERSEGQLALSGRWFGVRGRRFVRPTLTLALDGARVRALADLDDKPWAAEDGEPWKASFPWGKGGRVEGTELSVAPDITIQLPAPNGRRARPQRLAAQPRREVMTASWGPFAASPEAPPVDDEAVPREPRREPRPEPEREPRREPAVPDSASEVTPRPPEPDLGILQAEIDSLRLQLAEASNATAAAGAETEALHGELVALRTQLEQAQQELGRREAALRNAAQAEAEKEGAVSRAMEAEAERDSLTAENAQLTGALEQARSTVEQLTRQHDDAMATRGAALVMRGATQALPAYERHVGWVRRGLAVLLLIGIVFAVLIVLGAL